MNKFIIIKTFFLFFLFSCKTNPSDIIINETVDMLTDDSSKFWIVHKINANKSGKTKIVWNFIKSGSIFLTFRKKGDEIILFENGDELYVNTYQVLSGKEILLNGYLNKIEYITNDSLVIYDKTSNLRYFLKPH